MEIKQLTVLSDNYRKLTKAKKRFIDISKIRELRANPDPKYLGKSVFLYEGRTLTVEETLKEIIAKAEPKAKVQKTKPKIK